MKKKFYFIVLYILLSVFLFSTLQYNKHQKYIDEVSNGLYTKNKVEVLDNDIDKYKSISNDDVRIFIELDPSTKILVKNNNWKPNLIEGKFFSSNEIGNTAVIGSDYKKYLKTHSKKQYLSFLDTEFEVIGVVGEDFKSKTDSLLILNLEDIPSFNKDVKVVIDGENKISVSNYRKDFENKYGYLNQINSNKKNFNKNIDAEFFYYLIIGISFLLQIITVSIFLKYNFEKNIQVFYVQFILGFSRKKISLKYLKEITINILVSHIISSLLLYKYILNFKAFIFFNFLTLAYSIFISSYYVYIFFKKYRVKRGESFA